MNKVNSAKKAAILDAFFLASIFLFIISVALLIFLHVPYKVTPSTEARERLYPSLAEDFYTDAVGCISDAEELQSGMQKFYDLTGVQPYLYIVEDVQHPTNTNSKSMSFLDKTQPVEDLDKVFSTGSDSLSWYANELYNQKFSDGDHLLVLAQHLYGGEFNVGYACGEHAQTVIDEEASDILLDCATLYETQYFGDASKIFSTTFADAGERMMQKSTSPALVWVYHHVPKSIAIVLVICSTILLSACIVASKRK